MIGRVEETSASYEARSAPRLYPTEGLGVKFPGPTRQPQNSPLGLLKSAPTGCGHASARCYVREVPPAVISRYTWITSEFSPSSNSGADRLPQPGSRSRLLFHFDDVPPYRLLSLLTLRRQVDPCLRLVEARCVVHAVPLDDGHSLRSARSQMPDIPRPTGTSQRRTHASNSIISTPQLTESRS
jgi:hypothetical protein